VLAITFTRRAAGELVRRLTQFGLRQQPTVGTFHSVAWAVLRQRWDDQGGRRGPDLLVEPDSLLAELVEPDRPGRRQALGGQRRRASVSELATEISWAHARRIGPDRYEEQATRSGRRPGGGVTAVAEAYAAYEKAKRRRRLVDFDDLLALLTRELRYDPAFAEVQRWRFRHLFVDEMQDANPLQLALLDAWRGGRPDVCVVGDPSQAIYEWNGADPGWIQSFADHHPGATIIRLVRNYRSTPEIVAAAAGVLETETSACIEPTRPPGAPVAVHDFADELAEGRGIASLLRAEHTPGRHWSSCAVLVRTHAQSPIIERALRDAAIPVRSRGTLPLIADEDVRAALADAAARPEPGALRAFLDDLDLDVLDTTTAPAVRTLAALGRQFSTTDPNASVASFRAWLAMGSPGDDAAAADAVDIVTFHAAKGLEWPIVVVAGMERGLVPHSSATTSAARAEEIRLLHVALTRAEHRLILTRARRRNGVNRSPSPLLAALPDRADDVVAPPAHLAPRRQAPRDPKLDALEAWRRAAAHAAGLPEQTICSDRALAAVARARPLTIEELAALPEIGAIAARRLGPRLLAALDGIPS
jgi:DNA helicase-2/ATP-dependent DNA helicase PcrA